MIARRPRRTRRVGRKGERVAARLCRREGLRLVARNIRLPGGEIDLLFRVADGGLVVVEVKSRSGEQLAPPERQLDDEKRRRLRRLATEAARRLRHDGPVRIDLLAVDMDDRLRVVSTRWYEAVA